MNLGIILIGLVLKSPTPTQQSTARIDYIRYLSGHAADINELPNLLAALDDKEPAVRLEALKTWSKVGDGYYELLANEAYKDNSEAGEKAKNEFQDWQKSLVTKLSPKANESDELKRQAIRSLCAVSDSVKRICPPFLGCGTGIDETLWYKAGKRLDEAAQMYRPLFIELVSDRDPDVVYNVLGALGRDYKKSQLKLAKSFLSNPNKYFKSIGAELISEISPESSITLLAEMLEDKDDDVSKTAEFFISFSEKQALDNSRPGATHSSKLRQLAVQHLDRSKGGTQAQMLRRLLTDPDPQIRVTAISGFFRDGEKHDLDVMKGFLSDPSPMVRARVYGLAALAEIPNILPNIRSGLVSEDKEERESAFWAAGRVKNGEDLSIEMVRCVDLGVDENYWAWPAFDDPRFVGLLDQCIKSTKPRVRQLAAYHFEHLEKGPYPKDKMILLAKDPSSIVAHTMIAKLAEMPDQWAFDTLVELTESTNMEIRCFAIDWLGGTKQKELARAILEKLLLNDNPQVRKAARSGLENLKNENI